MSVEEGRRRCSVLFMLTVCSGAWIVGSAYMSYAFGKEILEGLSVASHGEGVASSSSTALAMKDY